ncbi:hypothetical protein DFH27DRAFT_284629 [Peziza echinospora]|nr:hypothetical protein DFH27DRAFT_284629 [Peziza echinospora]
MPTMASSFGSSSTTGGTAAKPAAAGDALIIGVDFGTTFSGVAWSYTGDPEKLRIIKNWPGSPHNLEKVSSILSYSTPTRTSPYQWGFEVKKNNPKTRALSWFKLLLDQTDSAESQTLLSRVGTAQRRTSGGAGMAGLETGFQQLQLTVSGMPKEKKPVDLVTDYLKGLHTHAKNTIDKAYPKSFTDQLGSEIPIKYCLTVPAVWSDRAKNLTVQAARAAGMNEKNSDIRVISEPEAAAVHCLKNYQDTENCLKVGDIYVIADCGGGTVDLISYQVTAIKPRLKVKECATGTGGLCGSTYLDSRFEALLKARLGDALYNNMTQQALSTTTEHFDKFLKPTFCPPDEADVIEDEDDEEEYFCPVPGVPNDANRRIMDNFMTLSASEMKDIFAPTFTEITRLVQEQVRASEERVGTSVTGILLVGGFGSSEYLRKHLSEHITSNHGAPINVLQPADAWTAIVRGAVLDSIAVHQCGERNSPNGYNMVQSRLARFSYGVKVSQLFNPAIGHLEEDKYFDSRSGKHYSRNRLSWLVKQGEEIHHRQPITMPLVREVSLNPTAAELSYREQIFCSASASPPTHYKKFGSGIHSLCVYTADFSGLQKERYFKRGTSPHDGEQFWEIDFQVVMRYDGRLEFTNEIDGKEVGKVTVEYNHARPN